MAQKMSPVRLVVTVTMSLLLSNVVFAQNQSMLMDDNGRNTSFGITVMSEEDLMNNATGIGNVSYDVIGHSSQNNEDDTMMVEMETSILPFNISANPNGMFEEMSLNDSSRNSLEDSSPKPPQSVTRFSMDSDKMPAKVSDSHEMSSEDSSNESAIDSLAQSSAQENMNEVEDNDGNKRIKRSGYVTPASPPSSSSGYSTGEAASSQSAPMSSTQAYGTGGSNSNTPKVGGGSPGSSSMAVAD